MTNKRIRTYVLILAAAAGIRGLVDVFKDDGVLLTIVNICFIVLFFAVLVMISLEYRRHRKK